MPFVFKSTLIMNKEEIKRITELYNEVLPFVLSDETYSFLQRLPEKQRLCFILRHIYDYSYKQIADTMGTTTGYVSIMLLRARSMIVVK